MDRHKFNNAERLDFSSDERYARHIIEDPLSDDIYIKAHRRAERREKQHRNSEKESAQHEKFQLERILDELKGPAWLKTLGVSGVTDSEKKIYEPKRDHFIREVRALLDKFNAWKEEEKRQKMQRERASTFDEEEEGDEDEEEGEEEYEDAGEEKDEQDDDDSSIPNPKSNPNGPPRTRKPPFSSRLPSNRYAKRKKATLILAEPFIPEKPFTSFYAKPHLREAAMNAHRRGGRIRTAFGHPLPDLPEQDFCLPREMLTGDVLAARARSRRAAKRDH